MKHYKRVLIPHNKKFESRGSNVSMYVKFLLVKITSCLKETCIPNHKTETFNCNCIKIM